MTMQRTIRHLTIGLLLAGLLSGCAQWKLPKAMPLASKDEDKPQVPQRLTALWSDTVLVEAGVAGFGGRLMFYGKGEDPVKVEGELTVFAYDDTHDSQQAALPARKYVFRAEDLEKHYSTSTLGHSYSFWIPWAGVGGPSRQISLIARFKSSKGGGVVMSEMTRHYLPGTQNAPATNPVPIANSWNTSGQPVQPAAHQALAEAPAEKQRLETTTITLPKNLDQAARTSAAVDEMLRRLAASKAQPPGAALPTGGVASPGAPASVVPGFSAANVQTQVSAQPQGSLAAQIAAAQANGPEAAPAARTHAEVADAAAVQDLIHEVRALRESVESDRSPAARSGLARPRARIEPRLPPARGPARMPPSLGAPLSDPASSPPMDPSTGSASSFPNARSTTIGQR